MSFELLQQGKCVYHFLQYWRIDALQMLLLLKAVDPFFGKAMCFYHAKMSFNISSKWSIMYAFNDVSFFRLLA